MREWSFQASCFTFIVCIRCLPLRKLAAADKDSAWEGETSRSLERGSTLVAAVAGYSSRTILQMPRGNLEAIHPRPLLLDIVKAQLSGLHYAEAIELLRRHRINLNLVVDHDPELFMANLDKFVADIADVQRMCLFVADLKYVKLFHVKRDVYYGQHLIANFRNDDVTEGLYASMYYEEERERRGDGRSCLSPNKIASVCNALMRILEKNDSERNILPIISCLVKSSDVDAALSRINCIRKTSGGDASDGVAADALDFLLLLVDVNALFDVALGLYDFDLVLFVAEKSQKVSPGNTTCRHPTTHCSRKYCSY